jgi:D-inositol-3-phosphate glycosyltransferase
MPGAEEKGRLRISLLSGGNDPSYAIPLLSALVSRGIEVDFVGNDEMQKAEIARNRGVNYLNFRGDQTESVPLFRKVYRILAYYYRLTKYAAITDSKLFHILWLNKFEYFDRTILNFYYKIFGKKLLFTAHNVNAGVRDENDTLMNRLTLKSMYSMLDHIFVHNEKMKSELVRDFQVPEGNVTVIPFGINNFVPNSNLTVKEAKSKLGLQKGQPTLLFFGQIAPYKGLDLLISALTILKEKNVDFRLIIAGKVKANHEAYWQKVAEIIDQNNLKDNIVARVEFIPDEDVEIYFKAADVLLLPYKNIFQTGVLFLAYNFGLPAIATDVGSLREDIVEGVTGMVCRPDDPHDLADAVNRFFESDLYKNLEQNQKAIMDYGNKRYSWEEVGRITCAVYEGLL